MVKRSVITEDQARYAMESGEFSTDIIGATENVAVVLTQGWCPQWSDLKRSLSKIETNETELDLHVFELVYDTVEYSNEFMAFKEKVFANYQIPYVRYYRNGELTGYSNWVTRKKFLKLAGVS